MHAIATTDARSYVTRNVPAWGAEDVLDYRPGRLRGIVSSVARAARAFDYGASSRAPTVQFDLSPTLVSGYEAFGRSMNRYDELAKDWDDLDAVPPSQVTRDAAARALYVLLLAGKPAPQPMLLETGVLGGFWRRGASYLSIDFEVDGSHPWAYSSGTGEYASGLWTGGSLPTPLSDLISQFG